MSVWVEMYTVLLNCPLDRSRSTWACELKSPCGYNYFLPLLSRSTWACELKLPSWSLSWISPPVTLHVSVWVEIFCFRSPDFRHGSRSTWACELKFDAQLLRKKAICHAPRERVSWNDVLCDTARVTEVTLHVSVWVEMPVLLSFYQHAQRHAPRERVSWNLVYLMLYALCHSHAPRERVSWNFSSRCNWCFS